MRFSCNIRPTRLFAFAGKPPAGFAPLRETRGPRKPTCTGPGFPDTFLIDHPTPELD